MKFSFLRIVIWIGLYLSVMEVGLEIRAHYRGFDTLLFGDFKRVELDTTAMTKHAMGSGVLNVNKEAASLPVETRYWIASSSHAEDSYLSRDVTFPSVLERLLRDSGINAQIINASRAGMEIEDNTDDLLSRGPQFEPDYVILYQMSSTIMGLSKTVLSGSNSGARRRDSNALVSKGKKQVSWPVRLVEQTALYAQLKAHLTSRLASKRVLVDSLGSEGDREFERKIRGFIAAARTIGATPILCTFSTSHGGRDSRSVPDSVATFMFKYNAYLSVAGWLHTIEKFNHILKRIAAQDGILLIDLEKEISGHPDYFRDFVHFTPLGHATVASVIQRALIARRRDINQDNVVLHQEAGSGLQ
jgi:hypothetical protein